MRSVAIAPDEGISAEIVSPPMPVTLASEQAATVILRVKAHADAREGEQYSVLLQASAASEPDARASSAVTVHIGESLVSRPLNLPIVLRPHEHENVQFGYDPDYMRNEVYFDVQNRPWIRQRTESHKGTTGIFTLEDGGTWVEHGFLDAIREAYPDYITSYGAGGFRGAKIGFDAQGGIYTLLWLVREGQQGPSVLLFSPNRGESWQVYPLRGETFDLEQFTGHNALEIPPPVLTYEKTADHEARFCSYHDLWLYMPRRTGNLLEVGEPLKVAENVIGSCQHSGGPASTVTRDGRTHIVWGEVTASDAPGVPTYVATFDHASGAISEKVLLGYGPPLNDVHNVPAITMDSEGYLHVLIGAHGAPFHYVRSLQPNDASAWTEAEPILLTGARTAEGEEGRQTYISLVCDDRDTLHAAFRQWRNDPEYHGGSLYAALSFQSRPKDGQWSERATPLVVGALPGYSVWYHKLTVDRVGGLWLSYSYYTSDRSYQDLFRDLYNHRAVIVSRDGGLTWKLAETADFLAGMSLYSGQ